MSGVRRIGQGAGGVGEVLAAAHLVQPIELQRRRDLCACAAQHPYLHVTNRLERMTSVPPDHDQHIALILLRQKVLVVSTQRMRHRAGRAHTCGSLAGCAQCGPDEEAAGARVSSSTTDAVARSTALQFLVRSISSCCTACRRISFRSFMGRNTPSPSVRPARHS